MDFLPLPLFFLERVLVDGLLVVVVEVLLVVMEELLVVLGGSCCKAAISPSI